MKAYLVLALAGFAAVSCGAAHAQTPFDHEYVDIKFIDAYFGTPDEKFEVSQGDDNVPLTLIFSNVGTEDITGISGQLSPPIGFSPASGSERIARADAEPTAKTGENFELVFFIDVDESASLGTYTAQARVDFARLRESGQRTSFFDFTFELTGSSTINMRSINPFLMSLTTNNVVMELVNDGTAPASGVRIDLVNAQTAMNDAESMTNIENVVIMDTSWDVGRLAAGESRYIETQIYVPESLRGETLRTPMTLTYFDAHGNKTSISKIVDFYVRGFIDLNVYSVDVIDLSGTPTVIGNIINEGNIDALFGFVTVSPRGESGLKETTQFIDEIETDSPVPFNVPVSFDGAPEYGSHDITISIRYKDDLREEHFLVHDATIFLEAPEIEEDTGTAYMLAVIALAAAGAGVAVYLARRRRAKVPA